MDYDVLPAAWLQWPAERLELEVRLHKKQYWDQKAPTISDYDYDRLVRRLRELEPTSAVLDEMGPTRRHTPGEPVEHAQPMLSLDKAYDEKSLLHWSGKFDGELVMTPMGDGVACSIRYDAQGRLSVAATRGSGTVGENITQNVSRIIDVPERIPVEGGIEVRGEIYLPLSKFAQLDGTFANPRNTAAGALKQKNADRSAQVGLRFFLYTMCWARMRKRKSRSLHWVLSGAFSQLNTDLLNGTVCKTATTTMCDAETAWILRSMASSSKQIGWMNKIGSVRQRTILDMPSHINCRVTVPRQCLSRLNGVSVGPVL